MVENTNKLEMIQNKLGRLVLGENLYVGREGMGWSTSKEKNFKTRLKYKIILKK